MTPQQQASADTMSRSVKGSRVLVTGAASGIGRATATLFAHEGADVAVVDINADGAAAVAESIVKAGGRAKAYALDVSDAKAVAKVVAEAAEALGGLDILINNAGITAHSAIDGPDYDAIWERMLDVLLTSQQRVVRAALPYLRRSSAARIVNLASTEGLGATAGGSPYSAGKAGVIGLTRSLAVELGREGITVNCICPGPVLTGMTQAIPDKDRETYAHRRTALRRYADPMELAHMIVSISLPAASFLTGAVIPVDGGLMAGGNLFGGGASSPFAVESKWSGPSFEKK